MPLRLAFFNHLLNQHPTARQALVAHAGRCIAWQLPFKTLTTVVTDEGWLAETQAEAEATVCIPQHALFSILSRRGVALDELRLEGDQALAKSAGELVSDLYWDAVDDLSRLVGDAPAHLADKALYRGRKWLTRAEENLVDQLQEPSTRTLVRRHEMAAFGQSVDQLAEQTAQVNARLTQLERK